MRYVTFRRAAAAAFASALLCGAMLTAAVGNPVNHTCTPGTGTTQDCQIKVGEIAAPLLPGSFVQIGEPGEPDYQRADLAQLVKTTVIISVRSAPNPPTLETTNAACSAAGATAVQYVKAKLNGGSGSIAATVDASSASETDPALNHEESEILGPVSGGSAGTPAVTVCLRQ